MGRVTRTVNNFFKMFGFEIVKYEKEKALAIDNPILHNSLNKINEFYSREDFFDTYIGQTRIDFYKTVVELISSRHINLSGDTVVDVGCGTGHLLHFVHEKFGFSKGTGLEYSSEAIRIAKKMFPAFEFYEYDVNNSWPEKYDFILCTEVLEHLLHPETAINNIRNMMKGKATVLITVPNGRLDTFMGHINFWSPESWDVFIKTNFKGFKIETGTLQDSEVNFALVKQK